MINIEYLKTKEDFERIKVGDKILIKYLNGKTYLFCTVKLDKDNKFELVGKFDDNYVQEIYIDIDKLLERDLGRYVDCIVKID